MILKLPSFCGVKTHTGLYKRADKALKNKEDIDIDCSKTVFTTGGFVFFLKNVEKKVFAFNSTLKSKEGVKLALINVPDIVYKALHACDFDRLIPIKNRLKAVPKE
jgi:hypothetical protein